MQSAEGDRAVNMSHAGFPPRSLFCHWNFTWKPKSGPETIQTLIHVQVNTLLIMVYAHCTDSTSHRQAVNATSCPAVAIVVLFYTHILHLWSFKGHESLKSQTDTIYYWIKVASAECFFFFFADIEYLEISNILMPKCPPLWLLRVSWQNGKAFETASTTLPTKIPADMKIIILIYKIMVLCACEENVKWRSILTSHGQDNILTWCSQQRGK